MRKASVFSFLVLVLILQAFSTSEEGACDEKKLHQRCASLMDDYALVKNFKITTTEVQKEYAYMFNKGTTYLITICDDNVDNERIVVELYRAKKLIASSFSQRTKKHYNKMAFPCTATGIYNLRFSFTYGAKACGSISLGFQNARTP
ncbi:MAG: hypothetical protein H6585_12390 [Flavobacteriales bacterium]|nr:hypothetical protein [Flavobacteriales bacterium]MCB9449129.1 hypothetical protein [Flavobacteriales bacterium]